MNSCSQAAGAKARKKTPASRKSVNLALQGGGAHGAFTWGVLDCLAEDERIDFDGISATSAGAMNAVVFTYGWSDGGRNGARQALTHFWRRISHAALASPLQPSWFDRVSGNHSLQFSSAFIAFDLISRLFSPYEFNPFNQNPLRDVLILASRPMTRRANSVSSASSTAIGVSSRTCATSAAGAPKPGSRRTSTD